MQMEPRITIRAILGPISLILAIGLLILKDSHIFYELAFLAITGVFLSWNMGRKGFAISSVLLSLLLSYEWLLHANLLTFWELGLSLSLMLSYFITVLAREEISEAFEETENIEQPAEAAKEPIVVKSEEKDLKLEITKLKASFKESYEKTKKLLESKAAIIDELESCKAVLENSLKEALASVSELQNAQMTVELLTKEIYEEKQKNAGLVATLENQKSNFELEKSKAEQLELSRAESLHKQLAEEKLKSEWLGEHFEKAQISHNQEITSQKLKNEELEKNISLLKNRVSSLEELLDKAEAKAEGAERSKLNYLEDLKNHQVTNEELERQLSLSKSKLVALGEQLEKREQDFERVKAEHQLKAEGLAAELHQTKETNFLLLEKNQKKIDELTGELEKLTDRLKEIEIEKDKLEQLQEDLRSKDKDKCSREFLRERGMHRQLREQFEKKSKILDETRKELFLAHEAKNKLEREYFEEIEIGDSEFIRGLERQIAALEALCNEQSDEIQTLQELITNAY